MKSSAYPTLLNRRARILATLSRKDLIILATVFLLVSWMKLGGLWALMVMLLVLIGTKAIERRIPRGFEKGLNSSRVLEWPYSLRGLYE